MDNTHTHPEERADLYELHYELTPEDVVEHAWSRWPVQSVFVLLYAAAMTLVGLLAYLAVMQFTGGRWPAEATFLAIVGGVAAVIAGYMVTRDFKQRVIRRFARRPGEGVFGARRLTISPSEIAVSSPRGKTVRTWSAVGDIRRFDTQISISAAPTILVPRRAFDHDDEFHEFASTIMRWWTEAREE